MKLKDLLENELTTCGYLKNIGIKFDKKADKKGADFEILDGTSIDNLIDELQSVPELKDFAYSKLTKSILRVDFI